MAEYFILGQDEDDDSLCAIYDIPEDMPSIHYPANGIRLARSFKEGLRFSMTDDVSGIKIGDVINNALGYFMTSRRLKDLLEKHVSGDVEYLRFSLLNHKRRVASDDCYIVNPIGTVDCVDRKKTQGEEDPVNPGRYMFLERLVLKSDKIDAKLNLFRIESWPRVIIVREDLKDLMEDAGMTGVEFLELDEEVSIG